MATESVQKIFPVLCGHLGYLPNGTGAGDAVGGGVEGRLAETLLARHGSDSAGIIRGVILALDNKDVNVRRSGIYCCMYLPSSGKPLTCLTSSEVSPRYWCSATKMTRWTRAMTSCTTRIIASGDRSKTSRNASEGSRTITESATARQHTVLSWMMMLEQHPCTNCGEHLQTDM